VNSVKNILVITVLLGVGYAVYSTINSQPGPARPPEQNDGWPTPGDGKAPNASDSKPAAMKNPFAAGGNQAAERVSARDAGPFGSSRTSPIGTAKTLSGLGPTDRISPTDRGAATDRAAARFSANGAKPADQSADYGQRFGNSLRPSDNPSAEAPGVAMSTDLPAYPPNGPPPGRPSAKKAEVPDARSGGVRDEFAAVMEEAHRRLAKGGIAEVHLALSRLYGNADLTPEESRQLADLLDQLAGTVIYSRQHILEPAYTVKPGETLQQIAQGYNVPWQLLAKINGIRQPDPLQPGKQLKVFHGPFEAVVYLDRYELVLTLGGRYAGRFPIGIGRDFAKLEGSYTVKRKLKDPPYYGPDRTLEPGDPSNPLGKFWLELGDRMGIHGTNDVKNLRRADGRGSICLGPRDIEDVYDILAADSQSSPGSKVTIRR